MESSCHSLWVSSFEFIYLLTYLLEAMGFERRDLRLLALCHLGCPPGLFAVIIFFLDRVSICGPGGLGL
jgi:hypothetical protein